MTKVIRGLLAPVLNVLPFWLDDSYEMSFTFTRSTLFVKAFQFVKPQKSLNKGSLRRDIVAGSRRNLDRSDGTRGSLTAVAGSKKSRQDEPREDGTGISGVARVQDLSFAEEAHHAKASGDTCADFQRCSMPVGGWTASGNYRGVKAKPDEDECVCGTGKSCFVKEGADYGACFADVAECQAQQPTFEIFCNDQDGWTGCSDAWHCQTIEEYNAALAHHDVQLGCTLDNGDKCSTVEDLSCYYACGEWWYLNHHGECDGSRDPAKNSCSAAAPVGAPNKYVGSCCHTVDKVIAPPQVNYQTGCDHLRQVQDATGLPSLGMDLAIMESWITAPGQSAYVCMAVPTDCTSECNGKAGLCDFCNPGDGRQGACCKKGETNEPSTDPGGDNVCNHQESSGMVFPFADNMLQSATLWKYECVVVPEPPAVECVWGDWSPSGTCSVSCGSGGTQTYTRSKEPASEACAETETENRDCVGISACESCVARWNVTEEVLVNQCEGKGETLARTYEVQQGAAECPHDPGETQTILCPTDCTGSWEVQGTCTGAGETLTEMFNRVEAEPGTHINGTEIAASSCNLPINGATQDSSTACPLHTCTCEHGEAETGEDCIEDGVTVGCVVGGCNNDVAGYYHNDGGEGKNCVANSCECDHGTALVSAVLCERNDETAGCVEGSCLDGYFNVDIGNGDGRSDCQLKECTCEFGKSATGSGCPENGVMQCEINECDSGYRNNVTDVRKVCVPNTCACANGEPLVDAVCVAHENTIGCSETGCDDGYHHEAIQGGDGRGNCVENRCTCDNGNYATGVECQTHGEQKCVAPCHDGHHLSGGNTCVVNTCACANGEPLVDATSCVVHGVTVGCIQEQCNSGYHPVEIPNTELFRCELNECNCAFGDFATGIDCPEDNTVQCKVDHCHSGYRNNDTEPGNPCVPNTCHCANGEPFVDASCEEHGVTDGCDPQQDCNPGHHYEAGGDGPGICVANRCTCENGFPLTDPAVCTEHESTPGCASCIEDEGFKLHAVDHSCVRDCEGSWNVTNDDFMHCKYVAVWNAATCHAESRAQAHK